MIGAPCARTAGDPDQRALCETIGLTLQHADTTSKQLLIVLITNTLKKVKNKCHIQPDCTTSIKKQDFSWALNSNFLSDRNKMEGKMSPAALGNIWSSISSEVLFIPKLIKVFLYRYGISPSKFGTEEYGVLDSTSLSL